MKIFCDYCGKHADIAPDELADWLVLDPESGAQMVMCASCESGPTPVAADKCPSCAGTGTVKITDTVGHICTDCEGTGIRR